MNPATRMARININTRNNIHFIFARNMMYHPTEEKPCPSQADREWIVSTIKRIAFSIQVGAVLELLEAAPSVERKWVVMLNHKDGTNEEIFRFRRRKRAEVWIANLYLFALDKPRQCE